MKHINVAIDGPAGAGKSTVAKTVAKKLSILYLDTGAMYRAMALKAIRLGIEPNDAEGVIPILESTSISVENDNGTQRTLLDGEDVSSLIRTQQVSKGASDIAVIPKVRIKLAAEQRRIAENTDIVMEGREIGSFVLPNSPCKFYVTASSTERARRRLLELKALGKDEGKTLDQLKEEIEARDYTDSHRDFAPLKLVEDAVLIDTTSMSIQQAVDTVIQRVEGIYNIKSGGEK